MATPPYKMPLVELGDIVYWYPNGDQSPQSQCAAAIVTSPGHENININVFSPTLHDCLLRDGVRHISDPNNSKEANENGRWDYTPAAKRLAKLQMPPGKEHK